MRQGHCSTAQRRCDRRGQTMPTPGCPASADHGTSACCALHLARWPCSRSWRLGCGRQTARGEPSSVSSVPEVHVVKPELRNLTCTVDQPGFVEAYEQTAIYSKVSGFIKKYYVDIGQQVKKGDLVVEIFVPELDEDHSRRWPRSSWTGRWSSRRSSWSWWPRANSRRRLPNWRRRRPTWASTRRTSFAGSRKCSA